MLKADLLEGTSISITSGVAIHNSSHKATKKLKQFVAQNRLFPKWNKSQRFIVSAAHKRYLNSKLLATLFVHFRRKSGAHICGGPVRCAVLRMLSTWSELLSYLCNYHHCVCRLIAALCSLLRHQQPTALQILGKKPPAKTSTGRAILAIPLATQTGGL